MKNNIFCCFAYLSLTLILMLTIFGTTPIDAMGVTEVTFGQVEAKAGDEVIVPVTIKNNPGFSTFRFRINYDMSVLEFVAIEKGNILTNGTMTSAINEKEQTLTFTWVSVTDDIGDGEIAFIKFRVLEYASGDYPLTVTYLSEDMLNENWEAINYNVVDGKIMTGRSVYGTINSYGDVETITARLLSNGVEIDTITTLDGTFCFNSVLPGIYTIEISKSGHSTKGYEVVVKDEDLNKNFTIFLCGDVNNDGRLNTRDYAMIIQYINGWDVNIDTNCADVNKDGKINTRDYAMIIQYLNGWDVKLQ